MVFRLNVRDDNDDV